MGVDHVFDGVGDHVARGEGIEHPVVAHSDSVVNGDGVELCREASELFDFRFDCPADIVEVCVAGHELCERIDYGYDRFAELLFLHAVGAPSARAPAIRRPSVLVALFNGKLIEPC